MAYSKGKMKINLFCLHFLFWTFSVIFSTISSSSSSSSSSSISLLGIDPQDEKYFKTEILRCRNGSKKFTRAQLNDDFCDCPDGTDEPGTSACPQGKFYCQNTGHQPILLYSSRVNDGICDCCDGSDEYDGRVKCPNVCWEAGKLAMDKLQKKIELYREGVTIRRKEVEQSKQEIAKDKAELSKLKYEEKILKRLVKQLEVRKEQVEKAEKKEHLDKEKDEKMKEVPEDKDGTGNKSDDEQKESSGTTVDDKIGPVKEPLKDQPEKDEYENNEGLSSDISENNEISREELGRLVASRWTGDKTEHQVDEIGAARDDMRDTDETLEITHDEANGNKDGKDLSKGNDDDGSSALNKEGFEEQKDLSGRTTSRTPSWLEKILDSVWSLFQSLNLFSTEVDKLDEDHVQKVYDESTTKLSDIQERISSLMEKLKHDFGVENEFYLLYDRCVETKQDKYVYKICPFKDAYQEEGYSKTELGQWEKFENAYSTMLFSNGNRCWNGPDRSLKVKLRCGVKTELADVDEPSRCEYVARLSTPVRCLEGKLEELERKLESMFKDQQHTHDEL